MAVAVGLGLLAALAAVHTRTPVYTGTAQIFVAVRPAGSSVSDLAQGSTFIQAEVNSYVRLATTPVVLAPVRSQLGLTESLGDLSGSVSASVPANTSLISVTARAGDAATAARVANAVASSLTRAIPRLQPTATGTPSAVAATVVEPAQAPMAPASPNTRLFLLAGLLVGAAAGVALTLARHRLAPTVTDRHDLAAVTDVPLLATLALDPEAAEHPETPRPDAASVEAFGRLRTSLLSTAPQGATTLLITSCTAAEGTSAVARQLAASIARTGVRVLLVDADLRSARTGVGDAPGLRDVLVGDADLGEATTTSPDQHTLDLLASGSPTDAAGELLASLPMATLLTTAASRYDLVLVDAPALLAVSDAAALARVCDGTLIVVRSAQVRRSELVEACATLDAVRATPLGCVLITTPRPWGVRWPRRRAAAPQAAPTAVVPAATTPAPQPSSSAQRSSAARP